MSRRWSLRARLTVLFTGLLALGLLAAGVVATTLLERSLVARLDEQLTQAAPRIVEAVSTGLPDSRTQDLLPSDFQVVFFSRAGEPRARWVSAAGADAARLQPPDLPDMALAEVLARGDAPRTADGWRVVTLVLTDARGQALGSAAVALPLTEVTATTDRLTRILWAIGAGIVLVGGAAGWWAVRRSLRPLREIEDVAGAIAGGDLTRRVPAAPTSTEVGRLSAALNAMLAQLEQAFAARTASEGRMRRFVADASHELRTPLATIRGYGELFRMGAVPDDDVAATVRRMEDAATRMGVLVEDLLALARLDEHHRADFGPVDLAALAAEAAADLRALDHDRQVAVVALDPAASGGVVAHGDEGAVRQVLANVVGNVARHTPAGTPAEIAVGAARSADGQPLAVIEVRDHGAGIAPEHADRVFERFYRADAGRARESGGSGLGLAIAWAIARAHGGGLALSPTPGGGATFRLELPLSPGPGATQPSPGPAGLA